MTVLPIFYQSIMMALFVSHSNDIYKQTYFHKDDNIFTYSSHATRWLIAYLFFCCIVTLYFKHSSKTLQIHDMLRYAVVMIGITWNLADIFNQLATFITSTILIILSSGMQFLS